MVNRDLKKCRNQPFFKMHFKRHKNQGTMRIYESYVWLNVLARGQIEWDLTMRKTIHLLSTCCSFEKNSRKEKARKLQIFYHFSRLNVYFPDFSKNSKVSKVQDEPCHYLCLQKWLLGNHFLLYFVNIIIIKNAPYYIHPPLGATQTASPGHIDLY